MSAKSKTSNLPPLSRRDFLTVTVTAVTAAAVFPLVGCGGGSGNSSDTAGGDAAGATGRVQITIGWPGRSSASMSSRYVPTYAKSIFAEMYHQDRPQKRYRLTVDRPGGDAPATQTAAFNDLLPVGSYVIAVVALSGNGGTGATVAAGVSQVDVKENQAANADVVLGSTLKRLEILGQPWSHGLAAVSCPCRTAAWTRKANYCCCRLMR